jgi:IS30 family transposase
VTSLVERVSRFTVLLRNNDRQSKPIMDKLIGVLQSLPHFARRSITFDRGTEFTDWPYLQAGSERRPGFAIPNRPGRKAPWKIPIAGPASGSRERSIRCRLPNAI